jgi:hypothetical protein
VKTPKPNGTASPRPLRGKYANLLKQGTNIAILAPDVVEHFPDSESVNRALRAFLAIGKEVNSAAPRLVKSATKPKASDRSASYDPRKGLSKSALSHEEIVR